MSKSVKVIDRRMADFELPKYGIVTGGIVVVDCDGEKYVLRIGRILFSDRRAFSLEKDFEVIYAGTRYMSEDEIERLLISMVDGSKPIGDETMGPDVKKQISHYRVFA